MKKCIACNKYFEKICCLGMCKKCYGHDYYNKNKQKAKENNRTWNKNNAETRRQYRSEWYKNNAEDQRIKKRQWRSDNVEESRRRVKEYRNKNKDKRNERDRRKRLNNPFPAREYQKNYMRKRRHDAFFILIDRIRGVIKDAIDKGRLTKTKKTELLLGCSFEELSAHLGPKPEGSVHIDHICPCTQAQNKEELIKLQNYKNLRWMEGKANISKGNKKTPDAEIMCRLLLGREWILKKPLDLKEETLYKETSKT